MQFVCVVLFVIIVATWDNLETHKAKKDADNGLI